MKLRLDLLEHLTADDILEEILANNHRFKPEPLLAKTGFGSLTPATPEERAKALERCVELSRRLEERARNSRDAGTPPMA